VVGLGHPGRARGSLGRRERLAKLATGYTLARATPVVQCPWGRRTGRRRQRASGAARVRSACTPPRARAWSRRRRRSTRGAAASCAVEHHRLGRAAGEVAVCRCGHSRSRITRLVVHMPASGRVTGRRARGGRRTVGAHTETYVLSSRHASPHAGATGRRCRRTTPSVVRRAPDRFDKHPCMHAEGALTLLLD
jgi:hypothetical protein